MEDNKVFFNGKWYKKFTVKKSNKDCICKHCCFCKIEDNGDFACCQPNDPCFYGCAEDFVWTK